jgi:deoxyribodipyrimidine photo-lyase
MTSIFWFRRDIRLSDQPALHTALAQGPVIPVFIVDPHLLERTSKRRQHFLWSGLAALDIDLRKRNSGLIIRHGAPELVLSNLMLESGATCTYAEEDFTPYARARDARVSAMLPLKLIQGQVVHHPGLVLKPDGKPYTIYTPYSRMWKAMLPAELTFLPAPVAFQELRLPHSDGLPACHTEILFPAGEAEAQRRLAEFARQPIYTYAEERNRIDREGTASLSPYLHFGMLSMRQAVSSALRAIRSAPDAESIHSAQTWLNELIWREFYISFLFHFPQVSKRAFNPALANIPWRQADDEFEAWKMGRTGVPVVDAAMRQLSATGWMHNRARMITASYLVKDLLIDWRRGERWFMENLLDGDPAANNGGWQWTAGTGTDAAPYFRIFNPVLQSRKFDPEGVYIRRWLPELAHLPSEVIHAPWEKGLTLPGYPARPLVEHELVKERTMRAYNQSKISPSMAENLNPES